MSFTVVCYATMAVTYIFNTLCCSLVIHKEVFWEPFLVRPLDPVNDGQNYWNRFQRRAYKDYVLGAGAVFSALFILKGQIHRYR